MLQTFLREKVKILKPLRRTVKRESLWKVENYE